MKLLPSAFEKMSFQGHSKFRFKNVSKIVEKWLKIVEKWFTRDKNRKKGDKTFSKEFKFYLKMGFLSLS